MIRDMERKTSSGGSPVGILEATLREQQTLRTPVALFSDEYDSKSVRERFTHLIPLSKPEPGEQYAFEVNLDACTGCKACVAACHSLNGLDEDESWRDMGLLVGTRKEPYLQTVTTACHHCEDPACANGCPVLAYDKDAATGIVRHLDDQCIGCSYCILKCPYDVPKFNLKRGIVRKCDMCQGRLAEGEAPACVQACPNEAIKIKVVKLSEVPDRGQIIAGAYESSYTRPTTTYVSSKPLPAAAKPADAGRLELDHGHPPLAWMLVLTQMSAGAFIGCAVAMWLNVLSANEAAITSAAALVFGLAGIALSVLHLGQPLKAWRAFLGWRKSWLSREIIAFGALPGGGVAIAATWWLGNLDWMRLAVTGTAVAAFGAVLCSVMVYVDTHRPFWSLSNTAGKFLGTMLMLGAGTCAAVWIWRELPVATWAMAFTLLFRWTLSLWELSRYRSALEDESCAWHRSALVLTKHRSHHVELCGHLLIATGLLIPVMMGAGASMSWMLSISLVLMFASQVVERHYFFTAAAGSKMPGN
ncbi:DmsC/YnfH family molybdoenzyme membrane anchor subunit [Prosthecobacter sp.]|uniref:DmsC/YnfH family molybdoenzyme membrane anchor subunit n=1 Tax=Prosthecobacter sp. TaxID=1965333 RepID=UPI001D76BFDF|nr:DmsC/YnfH family molybdoenzyme membrane anchor subunit [Prosthecobacter sp.]MCB1279709.1 dimethyl sulfoxide reductase anchor subunit [Prosthecobacter sp.]